MIIPISDYIDLGGKMKEDMMVYLYDSNPNKKYHYIAGSFEKYFTEIGKDNKIYKTGLKIKDNSTRFGTGWTYVKVKMKLSE